MRGQHTGGIGLGDDLLVGFTAKDNRAPDPLPTTPPFDRAALELARATCGHGPWVYDAASGVTCGRCGAARPGGWTATCLRGYAP